MKVDRRGKKGKEKKSKQQVPSYHYFFYNNKTTNKPQCQTSSGQLYGSFCAFLAIIYYHCFF
jgi:hypothetical protein